MGNIEFALQFYFGLNTFLCGYYAGKYASTESQTKVFLTSIGTLAAGSVVILSIFCFWFSVRVLESIDNQIQVRFLFLYFFSTYYDNLPLKVLEEANAESEKRNTNSMTHRIYRHCVKLMNKKNNYEYKKEVCA